MDRSPAKEVEYGGLPVYGRDVTRGACHIYYNTQSKMWVLGGAIGSPLFYMFMKVQHRARVGAVEGRWNVAAFNHKTHHFVSLKKAGPVWLQRRFRRRRRLPPSPAPTPTPLLPREEWCDRVELRCTNGVRRRHTTPDTSGRRLAWASFLYFKPLKAASNATLHLYFDHPYGEWVISLRKFAPPFFFIAALCSGARPYCPRRRMEHFTYLIPQGTRCFDIMPSANARAHARTECTCDNEASTSSLTPKPTQLYGRYAGISS